MEKTVEISKVRADVQLESVGYEECAWRIHLNSSLRSMMTNDVILMRHRGEETVERKIPWESEEKQELTDYGLTPGETYEYTLQVPLTNGTSYEEFWIKSRPKFFP